MAYRGDSECIQRNPLIVNVEIQFSENRTKKASFGIPFYFAMFGGMLTFVS